jgi:hypothetical protein
MTTQLLNVLWSKQQRCLHVETMDETIAEGMAAMQSNAAREFTLVATGMTRDEAGDFCNQWRPVVYAQGLNEADS